MTSADSKNGAAAQRTASSVRRRRRSSAPRARAQQAGPRASQRPQAQPGLVEAGRPDHAGDAVLDAPAQVVHDRAGVGEIDHHVASRPAGPVRPPRRPARLVPGHQPTPRCCTPVTPCAPWRLEQPGTS